LNNFKPGEARIPEIPSFIDAIRAQGNLKKNDFWKCGLCLCQNHCIVAASYKPAEIVTLDRCFWKELTTGVTTYKNEEIIEHTSITITVDPHQIALYGHCRHTDNQTGKELIFLNTASSNFLEGTNYNYSCKSLNDPRNCMEDFAMPEIRTINGMPNVPSCSTIVTLKASDIIPVTKFCMEIKLINNTESNSVEIKLLLNSCDLKIQEKASSMIIIFIDEGSYRFFTDLFEIHG
jgi:hypothetical protein